MAIRLASAGAGARRKETPAAPTWPTPDAPRTGARLSDDKARCSTSAIGPGDIRGRNQGPELGSRPDPHDQAEYVSEWDPRLV